MWSGLAVTNLGYWMQTFAQGWLVVQLAIAEGSPHLAPFYLGLVNLARGVPGVIFGLYGGVLADRIDRRTLLAWEQIGSFVTALALALFTIYGHVTVGWLVVLGGTNAIFNAIDGPIRTAMLPRLVPPRDLMSGIGLNQMAWHGSTLIGPLIGGLLVGPIGVGGIFLLKALSHLPIIAASRMIPPQPPEGVRASANPITAIGESMRFVLGDPVLRWTLLITLFTALCIRSYTGLLPAVAHDVLNAGATELSWLLAASGLGSLVGAAFIAPLGKVKRRGVLLCAGTAVTGALLVAFTLQHTVVPSVLLMALVGGATLVGNGVATGFMQTRSPDALRGRIMSLQNISFGGLNPLGVMLFGSIATFSGVASAIAFAGTTVTAVALFAFVRSPILRTIGAEDDDLVTVPTRA